MQRLTLQYIPELNNGEKEIILTFPTQSQELKYNNYNSKIIKNVYYEVLNDVKKNRFALRNAHKKFRDNKKIVLASVKYYGKSLQYASERLRDNKKIALTAIQNNICVFEYISDRLKNDKKIALFVVRKNGNNLKYVSEELKDNRYIVLAAVKNSEEAIKYASDKLKNDREFLIECYKVNINIIKCNIEFITSLNKIENNIFDDNFIIKNQDILHLIENKKNLCQYLLDNNKYEIIYKNEEIHEYIKINLNILIICLNDFDPDNDYNQIPRELRKQVYDKIFHKKITIIFIKFDDNFNITFIYKKLAKK